MNSTLLSNNLLNNLDTIIASAMSKISNSSKTIRMYLFEISEATSSRGFFDFFFLFKYISS